MSGGKGGSTSSTVEIPQYIEDAAKRNLARADTISQIGFVPRYGPDVSDFTPMQKAAFQNIADTASAYGTAGGNMSQRDVMGGMPEATTYAGGVRGYSSAPIFEQSMAELATRRPGQKALIDSLFIDPYSGVPGSNVGPMVDYTATPGDLGGISAGGGGGGGLVSYPGAGGGNGSALSDAEIANYSQIIADELGMDSFDPSRTAESQMTPEQYDEYQSQPMSNPAQLAADNIYMNNLGNANSNIIDAGKGLLNIEPSFDSPSSSGSYGGSLVTGGLSGNLTGIPGIAGNIADSVLSSVATEYAMELQGRNFAESGGSTYDPNMSIVNPISGKTTTGGYNFDPTAFSSDYGSANFEFSDAVFPPSTIDKAGRYTPSDMPDTSMTAIPGYTTPLPTTFEGPIPTGTTLPTGSTISNTYSGGFESRPSHSTDNDRPAGPGDTGYEQAQLLSNLQSGGTGIIYKDDRREVYVDGVLVGNPKSAESARKILARELAKKES